MHYTCFKGGVKHMYFEDIPKIIDCRHLIINDESTETHLKVPRYVKYYELDYNLEGGRKIWVDNKEYMVEEGSIIFRHPGQVCSSTGNYNMIMLTFDWNVGDIAKVKYIRNYSSSRNNRSAEDRLKLPIIFVPEHSNEILSIYKRLLILNQQPERKELTNAYIAKLLYLVCADASTHRIHSIEKDTTVDKVLAYINAHYTEKLTLEQLASTVYLNKHYLVRLFKNETGKTPFDFVIATRLEQAKKLLKCTNLNISDIAQRCGFETSAYFCKKFKNEFNITPLKYRNNT